MRADCVPIATKVRGIGKSDSTRNFGTANWTGGMFECSEPPRSDARVYVQSVARLWQENVECQPSPVMPNFEELAVGGFWLAESAGLMHETHSFLLPPVGWDSSSNCYNARPGLMRTWFASG